MRSALNCTKFRSSRQLVEHRTISVPAYLDEEILMRGERSVQLRQIAHLDRLDDLKGRDQRSKFRDQRSGIRKTNAQTECFEWESMEYKRLSTTKSESQNSEALY